MLIPALTYIGSGTASGGTVDFTSLSSSYKGYRFYIATLAVSASDIVIVQVSTDNGSNYISTGSYQMVGAFALTSTSTQIGFPIHTNVATTGNRTGYVDIYFNNIANSLLTFSSYISNSASSNVCYQSGIYEAQGTVNAIRFTVAGANNLSSGTIYQYGIT